MAFKPFGYTPVLKKEEVGKRKKKKERATNWKTTLYRLWKHLEEQRWYLVLVLFLVVGSSALSLLTPVFIGKLIDDYIVTAQFDGFAQKIAWLALLYILLSLFTYLQNYWMVGIAQQTVFTLRTQLFAHLQKLPVQFFDKRQHGELMSRITNDVENVSQTLNSSFIQIVSSVLTLTGTITIMVYLSPLLTLLTMLIIPMMFIGMRWITSRTGLLYRKQQQALGQLNGMIEETMSGQPVVKAYSRESEMIHAFEEKNQALRHTGFWSMTYSGFIPKLMSLLNNCSFAIVAGVGGVLALTGDGSVTVGTIVVFAELSRQFTRPLNDLANQFNTVLSAVAGAERVFAIMDEPIEEDHEQTSSHRLAGKIDFKDVTFRYDPEAQEPTIQRLSFSIQPGETAAFVGATGAGKTTILQLLARFYDPQEGAIYLDDQSLKAYSRYAIRSQIAFVLQDPFLFEASIAENIRYGKLTASFEEVQDAAKRANAHAFIERLPHGYETQLTADGSEISQGQKQLVAIARALIADPAILLLDEATSSIDTVTEVAIQEALEYLMKGRTSLVIAHRLNTVRKADKVFVMEAGEIIEAGTQQELLHKKGRYYEMIHNEKRKK